MGPKKKPEEEDDPEYSPLLEALVKSQQLMQQQMQAQQEALTQVLQRLADQPAPGGGGGGGGAPAGPQTKAKKIDQPTLGPPKTLKLATFRHWHKKFQGYVKVQRLQEECDRGARRNILRSFLDDAWGPLWDTGRLGILDTDDVEEICTHTSAAT